MSVMTKGKNKELEPGKFYSTPVLVGKDSITIRLPVEVAKYLELNKPEVYWSMLDGVVQISGSQPHMVIPALNLSEKSFIAHE